VFRVFLIRPVDLSARLRWRIAMTAARL